MALKVNCEACGKQFTTDETKMKTRALAGGIVEHFFDCPHCLTVFPVMKTNGQIRGLQKKQQQLEYGIKMTGRSMNASELYVWTMRQRKIKKLMDELNGKVKANAE